MPSLKRRRQIKKKKDFLAAYATSANLTASAKVVGIARSRHYVWMAADPEYVREFEEATNEAAQTLEDEAIRRAFEGLKVPIIYKGAAVGAQLEFSDSLLMFLLRGFRPDKYRDRGTLELPAGTTLAPPIINVSFVRASAPASAPVAAKENEQEWPN